MQRRQFTSGLVWVGGLAAATLARAATSEGDAALGVRAALERGADVGVRLSQ